MKRKLLKQIGNEWRSNLWLAVELLIISVVLWYTVDLVGVYRSIMGESMGVDINHVYEISLKVKPEDSPTYESPEESGEDKITQIHRVIARLRAHPEIESVAFGTNTVYNYNFWGSNVEPYDALADSASLRGGRINQFMVTKDYPAVFGMGGINGETSEQLGKVLEDGKIIVTSNLAGKGMTPRDLMNLRIIIGNDSSRVYTVGSVVEPIRRSETEPAWHSTIIIPTENLNHIYLRVKPEADRDFVRRLLEESTRTLNYGNVYVADVTAIDSIRRNLHRDDYAGVRNMYVGMGFLLLTVFLGILGTFWFRTQQRAKELAIRITAGGTRRQLFARLIGEGMLLLVLVTPLAVGADTLLFHNDLCRSAQMWGADAWPRVFVEALIAFGAMTVMIIGGILFPALRAMKIEPAVVLAGE